MSSETIPATPMGPAEPAPATPSTVSEPSPHRSGLASLLVPVEPVRATSLDADTDVQDTDGDIAVVPASDSSTTYKDTDGTTDTSSSGGTGGQPKSVAKALMLAWAQRIAKGGGTANKRLELAKAQAVADKARAQAQQTKTTETVNRSAGLGGGLGGGAQRKPSSGGGADKGGASKKAGGGARQGSGNNSGRSNGSSGAGGRGPSSGAGKSTGNGGGRGNSGRGNSGGGKGSSGSGGGGGNSPKSRNDRGSGDKSLNKPRTKNDSGSSVNKSPKDVKTPGGQTGDRPWRKNQTPNSKTNKGTGNGPAPKAPKNTKGPDAPARKQPADLTKDKTPKTNTKTPTDKASRDEKPKRPWHRTPQPPKNTKGPEDLNTPKLPGKPDLKKTDPAKPDAPKGPVKVPRKLIDLVKKPKRDPKAPTGDTKTDNKPNPKQPAPKQPQNPVRRTQKARETGYRHGTAVGEVAAQAGAYRDGVKDGIKARTEHGDREKREMDDIHARRKKQHEEKNMTAAATSADYHPATPKVATAISATVKDDGKVHLGAGAARSTISRGEIRNMKHFQDQMTEERYDLLWSGGEVKQINGELADMAARAQKMVESARSMRLGDKSGRAAAKAQDAVSVLAALADSLTTRFARAEDQVAALVANTRTRYGLIYKAAQDSDEQAPSNNLGYYVNQGA